MSLFADRYFPAGRGSSCFSGWYIYLAKSACLIIIHCFPSSQKKTISIAIKLMYNCNISWPQIWI